jgi:hypothetical protein
MSTEKTDPSAAGVAAAPSEEELRAAYEAELARITATDMIAQSAVSLLNIGARRMGPPPGTPPEQAAGGRDLEQVRDAVDGARALLGILERRIPGELGPLRDALSRLQMAYAAEVGKGEAGESPPAAAQQPGAGEAATPSAQGAAAPAEDPAQKGAERGPGPAESSGRLWVPGR